jgi:hypothetical protein
MISPDGCVQTSRSGDCSAAGRVRELEAGAYRRRTGGLLGRVDGLGVRYAVRRRETPGSAPRCWACKDRPRWPRPPRRSPCRCNSWSSGSMRAAPGTAPGAVRCHRFSREDTARQPRQARRPAAVRDGQPVAVLRPASGLIPVCSPRRRSTIRGQPGQAHKPLAWGVLYHGHGPVWWPTVIVTGVLCGTIVPGRGDWLMTSPRCSHNGSFCC